MPDDFDPELRTLARLIPKSLGASARTVKIDRAVSKFRKRFVSKKVLQITEGSVTVRLHRPASLASPVPGLLWIHGGGYIGGMPSQDDKLCQYIAEHMGIVVAGITYRVAPEDPYPAALHDCYAGLQWLVKQSYVDPTRVAIGGDSAGGGLAAALALYTKEQGEIPLRFQLLSYPMLDDRTATRTDIDERNFRAWNNKSNYFGWASYTGQTPGSDGITGLMAPSRYEDLSGLPPAWVGVGTLDLFHDEDVAYAERLQAAGVPCTLHIAKGAFHGFDIVKRTAQISLAYRASYIAAMTDALK